MRRWLFLRMARWLTGPLAEGRAERIIGMLDPEVHLVFPGSSTWAADLTGRDAVAPWFRQFAELHPRFEVLDVFVAGPPWAMRGATRIRVRIGDDYVNEGMQYLRIRWGRIVLDHIFEDTELLAAFDARLAAGEVVSR